MTNEECAWIEEHLRKTELMELMGMQPQKIMHDDYITYRRMWLQGDYNLHIIVRKIKDKLAKERQ